MIRQTTLDRLQQSLDSRDFRDGSPEPLAHQRLSVRWPCVYTQLERRVKALVALPVETMPQNELAAVLAVIGKDQL